MFHSCDKYFKIKIRRIKTKIGRLLEACILRAKKSMLNMINSLIASYKNVNKNRKEQI